MVTRLFTSLIAVAVVTGCSWAQEPTAAGFPPKPTNAVEDDTTDGETDGVDTAELFADVEEEPAPAEVPEAAEGTPEVAADNTDGPAMAAEVDQQALADAQKVFELTERIAAMETEIEELKQALYNTQQALNRFNESGEFGRRALGAMVEDTATRATMGELLQGKVRLNNPSDQSVVMYINGTAWTVVPGESFVHAPVGTVSFLYDPAGEPEFKGIQQWVENERTGQFELEFEVRSPNANTESNERSVVRNQ